MRLNREQGIAIAVAVMTIALILVVTVLRNGTSW
jgi:Mg2+/Co2+ transporter CorB